MPFNGSGTFSPASGNPAVAGTTILSSLYNDTVNDVANGLTNAVTRDGQGVMSVQFKIVNGTSSIPGLGFNGETSTGLYLPGLTLGPAIVSQGVEVARFKTNGNVLIGSTSDTGERLQVTGTAKITGNTALGGTLNVIGAATLAALTATTGSFGSTLGVTGPTTLGSTLGVTGAVSLSSTLDVAGNFSISTNKFTVAAASGNTTVAGTFGVTGATTLSSTLSVTGTTTLNGVTNAGGGVAPGNYVLRALSTTGDRLRIASLAAGSGVSIDVADAAETTTARPLTVGASNSDVYLGSSSQFSKDPSGNIAIGGTTSMAKKLTIVNNPNNTYALEVYNTASNGAQVLLAGNGATTPNKTIRVLNGYFEVVNHAYSSVPLSLTDAGNLTVTGNVYGGNFSGSALIVTQSGFTTVVAADATSSYIEAQGGTNQLRLYAGGGERVRIDASGNFGIGKAPTQKLDVQLSRGTVQTYEASTGINLRLAAASGYAAGASFYDAVAGLGSQWTVARPPATDALIVWQGDYYGGGGTERMRIDASGNVGIGIAPTHDLHISKSGQTISTAMQASAGQAAILYIAGNNTTPGSSSFDLQMDSTGSVDIVNRSNTRMSFYTNATERLRITNAGVIQDAAGIELGWKGVPQSSTTSGSLVVGDRGKHVPASAGVTVPASVFSIGDAVTIFNNTAGSITITQGASVTLRLAGTASTGNRTLAQRGVCTVLCVGSNEFVISGGGLS